MCERGTLSQHVMLSIDTKLGKNLVGEEKNMHGHKDTV